MDLNSYQRKAQETDRVPGRGDVHIGVDLAVPLLGLAGETGELLSEYKKQLRDGDAHRLFKERVAEELGDLLWYIANVASKFGLSLQQIAESNLEKTRSRCGVTGFIRNQPRCRLPQSRTITATTRSGTA